MVQPPERIIRSPTELFQTPTCCKSDGSWHVGSPFLVFLVPQTLSLLPPCPHPAGWLPPELLAFWTRCAQPPPKALRRMPPLEPEEEAAEREAAAEEERRKTETPSDIEVTAPSLLPEGPALLKLQQSDFCPSEPMASGSAMASGSSVLSEPRPFQGGDCSTSAPSASVMLGVLILFLLPPGPEGGPRAQWAPYAVFR